jgi:hypothetical protein
MKRELASLSVLILGGFFLASHSGSSGRVFLLGRQKNEEKNLNKILSELSIKMIKKCSA